MKIDANAAANIASMLAMYKKSDIYDGVDTLSVSSGKTVPFLGCSFDFFDTSLNL
jgi:hypothetical protein